jgi:hypothetical protein
MHDGWDVSQDAVNEAPDDMTARHSVNVRPARDVRLVEQAGVVMAYPGPHRVPVLPGGWAPLSRDQQAAVLRACDGTREDAVVFRLGSLWETGCEYRVYRLGQEHWAGLSVVSKYASPAGSSHSPEAGANRELIGLAWDALQAVRIAVDFFNWDLEAHGQTWRLDVQVTTPDHD